MNHRPVRTRPAFCAFGLAIVLALVACKGSDTPTGLVESGKSLAAQKDYKAAVVQFKAALQGDPNLVEARVQLGKTLLASRDAPGAIVELTKALEQKADENTVVPVLARALLVAGEYRKVTTQFANRELGDKSAQAALKVALATAWAAQGDVAKAEAQVAAALVAMPDYGPALLLKVRMLAGKRDLDGALALTDQILARDGTLVDAWLLKSDLLDYGKQDERGAEQALRKALEIDKTSVPAYLSVISLELRAKNIAAAKADAEKLRVLLPKHPQMTYVDAQIAYIEPDLPKARELAQQLLRVTSNSSGVLLLAGTVEAQLGSLVQAESLLTKALQIDPGLAAARQGLAQTYLRLSQPQKALDVLQPLLGETSTDAQAFALAGDAQQRLGDSAASDASFIRAAKINPDDARVATALAMSRLSRGENASAFAELEAVAARSKDLYADQALVSVRMRRGEFDAALATIAAMEKKQPNTASVSELRGSVQLMRRDYPAARAAFDEAVKRDPALFSAVSNLAAIDVIEKKPDAASQRLEAYIKADPRNPFALASLAELKIKTNAPIEEVRALLDSAIKVAPSEPLPRLQLMELLIRKRLFKDALVVAQEAAAAMPNDLAIMDLVGRAQMEAGDMEQAAATFRKLAGVEGNGAKAYLRLADIYKATGKRGQAESAMRKALDMDPSLGPAQVALVDLLVADKREMDALEFARRIQRERSAIPTGWLLEALVHARLNAPAAAIDTLKAGLSKLPNSVELARELYRALSRTDRGAETDRLGATWMKSHPKDYVFEYLMATNLLARGEFAQSELHLRNVVAQQPGHAASLNNLAWVLVAQGKPGATGFALRAVDAAPDRPKLLDTLALALAADKKFDQALTTQRRAIELAPEDNALHFNLAKIALDAGDKALAKQELTRLRELGAKFSLQAEVDKLMKTL